MWCGAVTLPHKRGDVDEKLGDLLLLLVWHASLLVRWLGGHRACSLLANLDVEDAVERERGKGLERHHGHDVRKLLGYCDAKAAVQTAHAFLFDDQRRCLHNVAARVNYAKIVTENSLVDDVLLQDLGHKAHAQDLARCKSTKCDWCI